MTLINYASFIKCTLLFAQMLAEVFGEKAETQCFYDAVNVILSLQSPNGGFPAWEPQRAFRWLEKFNPTEFFEDVLIEREYAECTSSAIQALVLFKKWHPNYRRKEIESSISRALKYIEDVQEPDGSWYGSWGICYTYGTWFAVEGLVACGKTYQNSSTLRKACQFLLSKQLPDGGWGESYHSSSKKIYTNLEGNKSNLVQTSWALLSLIDAGQAEIDPTPIHRGIRLLINFQERDGDFPQQGVRSLEAHCSKDLIGFSDATQNFIDLAGHLSLASIQSPEHWSDPADAAPFSSSTTSSTDNSHGWAAAVLATAMNGAGYSGAAQKMAAAETGP
ncbi:hypothetical protein M9H77_27941 [Catharanthus roseus]|uniref:Uncharacterized protein n=1 Tax=Catharanthus roseus TaxID=4058 RepID=A0ACC0AGM7_CATRO|nr:hypothetical protein M9H77_27941 [Catharanthus roseus]